MCIIYDKTIAVGLMHYFISFDTLDYCTKITYQVLGMGH